MKNFKMAIGLFIGVYVAQLATAHELERYRMEIKAKDKYERSQIANQGIVIEEVHSDYVVGFGHEGMRAELAEQGLLLASESEKQLMLDFPNKDAAFHNYTELVTAIKQLAQENPDIVALEVIGKTHEGRDIYNVQISTDLPKAHEKAGIVFMGGHHAREHLSVEMPILLAQYLVKEFRQGNAEVVNLVSNRDIHIIPAVNPDGLEHDIADGNYKMWRKNRAQFNGRAYGVDLNRNYGYKWGTGGSSKDRSSDTYMGPVAFSEPETQAIKSFVENQKNLTVLLTFHTFSELILYPWGHSYNAIGNQDDFRVHEIMAKTMARWNGYTPQQSSDLYIASGDTTDWSYGEHGLISFTFELDPRSMFQGGFYPGASKIDVAFQKNLKPCLYLIEKAQNPYQVLQKGSEYGLDSLTF